MHTENECILLGAGIKDVLSPVSTTESNFCALYEAIKRCEYTVPWSFLFHHSDRCARATMEWYRHRGLVA